MNTGIIWFRNALRLNDNRVLVECLNSTNSQTILPLYIFEPHLAPIPIQENAMCIIGKDYPEPMVDRKVVAKENLAKFKVSAAKLRANN